jgi:hypothetical protein
VNGACPGGGWTDGDLVTYPQIGWSAGGIAPTILTSNYGTVYASTFGVLEIGIAGSSGSSIQFSGDGPEVTIIYDWCYNGVPDVQLVFDK